MYFEYKGDTVWVRGLGFGEIQIVYNDGKKELIIDAIYPEYYYANSRTVKKHITNLIKKTKEATMHYSKTAEFRAFLKAKRLESKENKNMFPFVNVHAKVLRILNKLGPDTFNDYEAAYHNQASILVNKEAK